MSWKIWRWTQAGATGFENGDGYASLLSSIWVLSKSLKLFLCHPADKPTTSQQKDKKRKKTSVKQHLLGESSSKRKKKYICVLWHTSDTDQFRVNFVLLHNISSSRLKTSHGCKLNTHCMITVAPCELSRKEEIPTKRMDSYYKNNPSSLMTQEERVSIFSGLTVRLYCPYFLIILRDDLASHQIKASHQYFSPASSTWPYYKLQPTYPA